MKRFSFATGYAICLSFFASHLLAETVVVPESAANVDTPNAVLNLFPNGTRYQFLYKSADLVSSMPNGAFITALAFRNDAQGGRVIDTVVPDLEVRMGTTPSLSPVLSVEFAQNIGGDYKVVFPRGALPVKSSFFPGQVNSFEIEIPLKSEFFYHPQGGNLLLDIFVYPLSPQVAVDMAPPGTVRAIIGATDPASTIGAPESAGPVIQITFSPIPEPSGISLLLCGMLFLLHRKLR